MFSEETWKALAAPLDRSNVKKREQAGRKFSYIEGWHAIAEANRIFGFDGWTRETIDIRMVAERERKIGRGQYEKDGWSVSYTAKVRVIAQGVAREGIGAGHGIDADLGLAHESAIKEAETDAMKRALMTFGNPFGLALYDKDQTMVSDEREASPPPKIVSGKDADTRFPSDEGTAYLKTALETIEDFQTVNGLVTWYKDETAMRNRLLSTDQIGEIYRAYTAKGKALRGKEAA